MKNEYLKLKKVCAFSDQFSINFFQALYVYSYHETVQFEISLINHDLYLRSQGMKKPKPLQ